ncbi:MAG: PVC-type heme-binding CxxCH protein, partial [Limisphaerales bacterium]
MQGTSFVGKPGASREERTAVNGSIWRFHPVRRVFELVAQGTTNPWGADWDEHGELFFINTVIGHLWHAIPGAYFKRMYGPPFNRYVYEEIEQVADHVHWDTREAWNDINKGISSTTLDAGGGHAHTGLMMYLGDNWPQEYRNEMFTLNFHGKRINHDKIERAGATYAGRHEKDLMAIDDPYFRGIDLLYGPEGGVYVSDWSDIGECHDHNGVHRKSGRIYRITHGTPSKEKIDLTKLDNSGLVKLLSHRNEWYVRQARQRLQERSVAGDDMTSASKQLQQMISTNSDARLKLRALWALYGVEGTSSDLLRELLRNENEHVRVWAIRLLVDRGAPSGEIVSQFASMAGSDKSGLVLCYLASAMQRIPVEQRWGLAHALTRRSEFEGDRVLPLMAWYGIGPAIPTSPKETIDLVRGSQFEKVRELTTRRVFEDLKNHSNAAEGIVALLYEEHSIRPAVLRGMAAGLQGAQNPSAPRAWTAIAPSLIRSEDKLVGNRALELDAIFGNMESQ